MRTRSQAQAAQRGRLGSVFPNPAGGGLAIHAKTPEGVPGASAPGRSPPPAALPEPGYVVNAFWQKRDLVLVVPDPTHPSGVRYRRSRAEHSCFLRREDLTDPVEQVRKLNSLAVVRSAVWEGDWLRVCMHDRDVLKDFCKKQHERGIQTYEGVVSPVLRHMVDNDLRPAKPRPIWVDIEVDSRLPFRRQIAGESRILCWALVDEAEQVVATGMLEEDTDAAECRLLEAFWAAVDKYDQVIAWAGDRYDFPVIKARSTKHDLLRPEVREWRRWLWLDHLEHFKRMNMNVSESGEEKVSFKLNTIAMSLLGEGKEDFDSSKTWEAWIAGGERRAELMRYNVRDTVLMVRIEKKTGYLKLLQTVADVCGTFPDSRGAKPSIQVEGFLARLAHSRGHKFPTVFRASEQDTEQDAYLGAYVLHPEENAGILRDVHVGDFSALYPSIIVSWNMSPETIVPKGQAAPAQAAYSPLTDVHFRTDVPGLLPEALKQLMALRAQWNKKKAALPPGTEEWKDADRRAGAYKIAQNSFYGVIGLPTSRHYDRRVAESVTQCGKFLIVETIKAAEACGMKVVYGDTDSVFVQGATRTEFEQFVAWCNANLYPRLLEEKGGAENLIKLAYEKQFNVLVISTAKRYVGSYAHYKGTEANQDSQPEIKGLEFKRGDSLRMARQLQEEVTYKIVGFKQPPSSDPADFEAILEKWIDRVMNGPLELADVLISKRLSKDLELYQVANNPMVRVAQLLDERGRDVGEGAKIDYVVVDASKSPQEVIPAEDYDPETTPIDRMAMWDKLTWKPTERLLTAAFPSHPWGRFANLVRERKRQERALVKEEKARAKALERDRKKEERAAAKAEAKKAARQPRPQSIKADRMDAPWGTETAATYDVLKASRGENPWGRARRRRLAPEQAQEVQPPTPDVRRARRRRLEPVEAPPAEERVVTRVRRRLVG